jgi:hypothetical protein
LEVAHAISAAIFRRMIDLCWELGVVVVLAGVVATGAVVGSAAVDGRPPELDGSLRTAAEEQPATAVSAVRSRVHTKYRAWLGAGEAAVGAAAERKRTTRSA